MASINELPRDIGSESELFVSQVAAVPEDALIRSIATIVRANEAAKQFVHGYGPSYKTKGAVQILEDGLPDIEGRNSTNAELFWGLAAGTVFGEVGDADLVNVLVSRHTRMAMLNKPLDASSFDYLPSELVRWFGAGNVKAAIFNGARMAMANALGLVVPDEFHQYSVRPSAVAAAAWLHGGARNPLSRIILDRSSGKVKGIDDGVAQLLEKVPMRKVNECVDSSTIRHAGIALFRQTMYWGAAGLHHSTFSDNEDKNYPRQNHAGKILPTDILFGELRRDVSLLAKQEI